jgi:hypothetical protein
MPALLLVVALLAGDLVLAGRAIARDCVPCTVGQGAGRCVPNGGVLIFNSVPPNVPAYWTLFADALGLDSLGRLDGELAVFSDAEDPGVPGFPGTFDGSVFIGESASFSGRVHRNRLQGRATYADGSTCGFRLEIAFGLGGSKPNRFLCRDGTGAVTAEGGVDVQGIRLLGCRQGRR